MINKFIERIKAKGRKDKHTEEEVLNEATATELCGHKVDYITFHMASRYHATKLLYKIYTTPLKEALANFNANGPTGETSTTYEEETGFKTVETAKNNVLMHTSPSEIAQLRLSTFNHACGQCTKKDPLRFCLVNAVNRQPRKVIEEARAVIEQ